MTSDEFDAFLRACGPQLREAVARVARRYRLEPDDALQEALLRAYVKRETFESEAHALNWVRKVAHDLLCDQRRSWYGRRVAATGDLPEAAGAAPDPADVVARQDAGREVLRALGALPPAHRLLLWEHAVDGRSYADIARETARPLATVRSVALRARAAARRQLAAGEGTLGLGVAVRLRGWWARGQAYVMPQDVAAALVVLTLGFGAAGLGSGPGPVEPAPQAVGAVSAAGRTATASLGRRAVGGARAAAATGADVPSVAGVPPAAPDVPADDAPFDNAAFSGDSWGSCVFDRRSSRVPFSAPLVGLGDDFTCDVRFESTACATIPAEPSAASLACSVSVHGRPTGDALSVDASALRRCTGTDKNGVLTFHVDGLGTYSVPSQVTAEGEKLTATASPVIRGHRYYVSAQTPFVCAERLVRTKSVTGRAYVAD